MKLLSKFIWSFFMMGLCSTALGQMEAYHYQQELKGISTTWHKFVLPNELYARTSQSLNDIRIYGVTEMQDTLEAPYLMRKRREKVSFTNVTFQLLNLSENEKGYYFTFELKEEKSINQIKLDFAQENFDWRIKLEGSQEQQEWFTLLEDYRILSIKNKETDYQYTNLSFPLARYRYFRVFIEADVKPELKQARISQRMIQEGNYRKYTPEKQLIKENKKRKQTEVEIKFSMPVRISRLHVPINDDFDYFRSLRIQYLSDSVKTEKGWKYNYRNLSSGSLNSMEKNEFQFDSRTVQQLKLIIDNQDNQPLSIGSIEASGYLHELNARFTEDATYYLVYGNKAATQARYDIERFTDNIPEALPALSMGQAIKIAKAEEVKSAPLFENKAWLWGIMAVIIVLLGWFSFKMMKKEEE